MTYQPLPQLQKINYEQDEELLLALSQAETADGDLIQPEDLYRVAIAVGLPLKNELLTALIQKFVAGSILRAL